MDLKQQISEDLKNALKEKDKVSLSILRMISAALKNKEIDSKKDVKDADVIEIIGKEIKSKNESIEQFGKGGRDDLVKKEEAELEVLKKYLPEQMDEEEVKKIISETVEQVGAKSPQDMGKVMGPVMGKTKGRFDNKRVSELVKEALSN